MPEFSRPTILMCPPDFYGIEYEINPWMSRSRQSDPDESRRQWNALRSLLESLDADVRLMQPLKGLPDLVFTANAGLVLRRHGFSGTISLIRPGKPKRPSTTAWFRSAGFQCVTASRPLELRGGRRRTLLRRHAVRRIHHPQRCRGVPLAGRARSAAARSRCSLSTSITITSTRVSARSVRHAGDLLSGGIRRVRAAIAEGACARPDRSPQPKRRPVSRAMRSSSDGTWC